MAYRNRPTGLALIDPDERKTWLEGPIELPEGVDSWGMWADRYREARLDFLTWSERYGIWPLRAEQVLAAFDDGGDAAAEEAALA